MADRRTGRRRTLLAFSLRNSFDGACSACEVSPVNNLYPIHRRQRKPLIEIGKYAPKKSSSSNASREDADQEVKDADREVVESEVVESEVSPETPKVRRKRKSNSAPTS